VAAAIETTAEAHKPARRPLPEHLPREDRRHPAPCTCPGCGGALRKIADEVSETLDYVPGRFKRCYGASGEDKASSSLDTTAGDAPCRRPMT
jgi:transposase